MGTLNSIIALCANICLEQVTLNPVFINLLISQTMWSMFVYLLLLLFVFIFFFLPILFLLQKADPPAGVGVKRSPSQVAAGTAAKRKLSPIRFEPSTASKSTTAGGGRKQTREIYRPPRDQFSKKVTNGTFQDFGSYRGRGRGRGGGGRRRGRGRGFRGTWRQY